ncbi:hypothetical protein BDV93DRAFT_523514 [Ceratobasidium sp. AG-I]|nr:hypothetical protein BDV93DRAFT_523514 [Ceratobasidium sp. AG-I]
MLDLDLQYLSTFSHNYNHSHKRGDKHRHQHQHGTRSSALPSTKSPHNAHNNSKGFVWAWEEWGPSLRQTLG